MNMRDIIRLVESRLVESRHPDVLTMYHGTTTYAAKQISQLGFIPNPEDKHFTEEHEDLQSLSGSYFTNELQVAVLYAYRYAEECADAPAVIVANIELAKAVPDEDVVVPAFRTALKQRSADAFVQAFHNELVGGYVGAFDVPKDLLLAMRSAWTAHEKAGDDDGKDEAIYRDRLNDVCHAYAAMAYETNPRYLGGNDGHHTVRLPQGLGVEHIVSITTFIIGDEHGQPVVKDPISLMGTPLTFDDLNDAVMSLYEEGEIGDDSVYPDVDDNWDEDIEAVPDLPIDEARRLVMAWGAQTYPEKSEAELTQRVNSLSLERLMAFVREQNLK